MCIRNHCDFIFCSNHWVRKWYNLGATPPKCVFWHLPLNWFWVDERRKNVLVFDNKFERLPLRPKLILGRHFDRICFLAFRPSRPSSGDFNIRARFLGQSFKYWLWDHVRGFNRWFEWEMWSKFVDWSLNSRPELYFSFFFRRIHDRTVNGTEN